MLKMTKEKKAQNFTAFFSPIGGGGGD